MASVEAGFGRLGSHVTSYGGQNLGERGPAFNTAPHVRPAGKVTSLSESAKACIQQDLNNERPITPPEISRYRRTTQMAPGRIIRHPGMANDEVPGVGPYGMRTVSGDCVADLVKQLPGSELMQWNVERKEDIYASSKREPLGRSALRGHTLPPHMGTDRAFGVRVDAQARQANPEAKETIFPSVAPAHGDEDSKHGMYIRSHLDYAPGEQRRRGYDWAATGVDPATYAFGLKDKSATVNAVAKLLNPAVEDPGKPSTAVIVDKRMEDFKRATTEELGRVKISGQGLTLPPGAIFGMPSRRIPELSVGELLRGMYSKAEQEPDLDLGKSIRPGLRNTAPEGRVFGAPSIRTDLPAPKFKSVADDSNYGNEPDAAALLYVSPYADRGVTDDDYLRPYTKAELSGLLSEARIAIEPEELDRVFDEAAAVDGFPGRSKASLCTFRRLQAMLAANRGQGGEEGAQ